MTKTKQSPRKTGERRFKLYFGLMNLALAGIILLFSIPLLGAIFDFDLNNLPKQVNAWIGLTFGIVVTIIPFILMVGRFMRDEYAELLWRRTALVMAYASALVPPTYYIVAWTNFFVTGQPEEPPFWLQWASEETKWGLVIFYGWHAYMIAFVVIFQFLRFKDSR